MTTWHYVKGTETVAVSEEQLRQMVAQGKIGPTDLLWREGFREWVPAGKIEGLMTGAAAQPQPMSGAAPQANGDESSFTLWYINPMKKYADFSGRAQRKEYWMFVWYNFLVAFGLGFMLGIFSGVLHTDLSALSLLYSLGTLLPSIAVGIRRMHDTDHSGWWIICPFVNLYFCCIDGQPHQNRFGADPKGRG